MGLNDIIADINEKILTYSQLNCRVATGIMCT